jgi:L-galactono-1,4-lactone dehydrogenase
VDELRTHGLTLENFASIAEQQIGGFISVSTHGTGAAIPPHDEQVVSLKVVTPAEGTVALSAERDPEAFRMARVGLGALGVVSEVTLQCVENHKLLEHTFVATRAEIRATHATLLSTYQHVRYMWIPHTDAVVVVGSNPCAWDTVLTGAEDYPHKAATAFTDAERLAPLRDLLARCTPGLADMEDMSFSQLRDHLLAADTLNAEHVVAVNKAEAEFWRRNQGCRIDESFNILQFDCGGQQWVYEVVFPTGTGALGETNFKDLDFMQQLLSKIESDTDTFPAPAPIEQRWSSSSTSPMSPASNVHAPDTLQCWVGIIMYIPTNDQQVRAKIAEKFKGYCKMEGEQMPDYNAQVREGGGRGATGVGRGRCCGRWECRPTART